MNDNNSIFCDFCNKKIDVIHFLTNPEEINMEYLQELLRDHKVVSNLSQIISRNIKRLLEREIMISRHILFHQKYVTRQSSGSSESLPYSASADKVIVTEKVLVPVHLNPTYNFIGRILGPGGLTLKQIEREFDCKIKIRGKGSVRNITKENTLRKRSHPTNQQDELHLIITVAGEETTARHKIKSAENYIKLLFDEAVSKSIDEDEAKQNQLMEYAIVKGTYRDMSYRHNNKRHSTDANIDSSVNAPKRQIFQPSPYITNSVLPGAMSPMFFYNQLSPQMTTSLLSSLAYPCKIGMFNIE